MTRYVRARPVADIEGKSGSVAAPLHNTFLRDYQAVAIRPFNCVFKLRQTFCGSCHFWLSPSVGVLRRDSQPQLIPDEARE